MAGYAPGDIGGKQGKYGDKFAWFKGYG